MVVGRCGWLLGDYNWRWLREKPRLAPLILPQLDDLPTHLDDLIDEPCVQHPRHEPRADALDLVGAGLAARQDRGLGGLDGDELAVGGGWLGSGWLGVESVRVVRADLAGFEVVSPPPSLSLSLAPSLSLSLG
jgi:hypothetical protein